jgi:PLD-like domain
MGATASTTSAAMRVVAYRGDAKTLLAFDLSQQQAKNLAGFTIQVRPPGIPAYYLHNTLRFRNPAAHAQVLSESPNSSVNAPLHKFRWLHVPGALHQGIHPVFGMYTYAVTPRYFNDKGSMLPLDQAATTTVDVQVGPLDDTGVQVGFTRGYVQSQAFAHHFGLNAKIRPATDELIFDTSQPAGTNAEGQQFTYEDIYEWSGFTARDKVYAVLDDALTHSSYKLDVFAYDLNDPHVCDVLLQLAEQGRVRVILDNAALHHSAKSATPEDTFESLFTQKATGNAAIKRGKFGRYAHDKVLIVRDRSGARQVLTGSTNFSVTGMYVNANHVVVFPKGPVASEYARLFQTVWDGDVKLGAYLHSDTGLATERFPIPNPPSGTITFAPHPSDFAGGVLGDIVKRIHAESAGGAVEGTVLFAVMGIGTANPVYDALNAVHADTNVFSMGISDSPAGISLYAPGKRTGVLVTGKPNRVRLPPPFNQVPGIGAAHEIHHKFVVCGFAGSDPVVYCGSSNLALGGEENNGDNLLEIHDRDVVTAFAIEALALVDTFQFLGGLARSAAAGKNGKATGAAASSNGTAPLPPAIKQQAATAAGWFLSTTDAWTRPYFDPNDLHCADRQLFASPAG